MTRRSSSRIKANGSTRRNYQVDVKPNIAIGSRVRKHFPSYGWFDGKVESFDAENELYHVLYSDGDSEDLDEAELTPLLQQSQPKDTKKMASNKKVKIEKREQEDGNRLEKMKSDGDDDEYVLEGSDTENSDDEESMDIDQFDGHDLKVIPSPSPVLSTPAKVKSGSVKQTWVTPSPKDKPKKKMKKKSSPKKSPSRKPTELKHTKIDGRDISKRGLPKGALACCPSCGFRVRALESVPPLVTAKTPLSTLLPGKFTIVKVDEDNLCPEEFVGRTFASSEELHGAIAQHNEKLGIFSPKISLCTYNLRAIADPVFSSWDFVCDRILASECCAEKSDREAKDHVIQIRLSWDGDAQVSASEVVFWQECDRSEPGPHHGTLWAFLEGDDKTPSVLLGVPAALLEFRDEYGTDRLDNDFKEEDNDDTHDESRFAGADYDLLPQPRTQKAMDTRRMKLASSLLQKTIRRSHRLSSTRPLLEAARNLLLPPNSCPGSTFEFLKSLWASMMVDVSPFQGSNDCLGLKEIVLLSLVAKADPFWVMPAVLRRYAVSAALRTHHLDVAQQWIGFVKNNDDWWVLESPTDEQGGAEALALRNVLRAVASVAGGTIKWGKWNKFLGDTSAASILAYLNHKQWKGSFLPFGPDALPGEEELLLRFETGHFEDDTDKKALDRECQLASIEPSVIPQSLLLLQSLLVKPPTKWKKHSLPCLARQWRRLVTEANPRYRAKQQLARLETWGKGSESALLASSTVEKLCIADERETLLSSFKEIVTPTGKLSEGEEELMYALESVQSWQSNRQLKTQKMSLTIQSSADEVRRQMTRPCRLTAGPPLSKHDGRWAFILAFASAIEVEVKGEVVSAMFCGTPDEPLLIQRIGKARKEGKEMATAGGSESGATAVPSLGYVQRGVSSEESALVEEAERAVAEAWKGGKSCVLPLPPPGVQWKFEEDAVGWDESGSAVTRTAELLFDKKGKSFWKFSIGGIEVDPFDARKVILPCALKADSTDYDPLPLNASQENHLRSILYASQDAGKADDVIMSLKELHSSAVLSRKDFPDEGAVFDWMHLASESAIPSRTWRDALLAIRTRDAEHVILGQGVRLDGTGTSRDMTEGVLFRIFHALEYLYPMVIRKEAAMYFRIRPRGASYFHLIEMLERLGRDLNHGFTTSLPGSNQREYQEKKPDVSGKRMVTNQIGPYPKRRKRKAAVAATSMIMNQAGTDGPDLESSTSDIRGEEHSTEVGESIPLPTLSTKLWEHQEASVAEVVAGVKQGKRGHADASAVGSGKTLVALATIIRLAEWIQKSGRKRHGVLIMLPSKALIREWLLEIANHTNGFHVIEQREDGSLFSLTYNKSCPPIDGNSLIISTLDRVARHPFLRQSAWDFVVIDECLAVQNADAKRTPSAWRQIEVSQAGVLLLSATFFRSKYDSLFYMIRMLRSPLPRSKEWLPATIHEHIVCKIPSSDRHWVMKEKLVKLGDANLAEYRGKIDRFRRDQLNNSGNADGRQLWIELERFIRRKYEGIVHHNYSLSSLYGDAVVALVKELHRKQRRPLVFADTEKEKEFLLRVLQSNNIDARTWHQIREDMEVIEASKKNRLCIVASKKPEGFGLNMQRHADTLICRPTPGDILEQMKGRVDRPAQKTKELQLHVLVCEHTIEEAKYSNIRLAGNFFREYIAPVARAYREKIDLEAVLAVGGGKKLTKGTVSKTWRMSFEKAGQSGCFASEDTIQVKSASGRIIAEESVDNEGDEDAMPTEKPKYKPLNKVIRNKGDPVAVKQAKEKAKQGCVSAEVSKWLFPSKTKTTNGKRGLPQFSLQRFSDRRPPMILDKQTIKDAVEHLSKNDPKLGALIARVGPDALMADCGSVKPPTQCRLFDRCIRAITFTMVSVDAGNSFLRRLAIKLGVCVERLSPAKKKAVLQDFFDELCDSQECTAQTPQELLDRLLGGLHNEIKFTPQLMTELVKTCELINKKQSGYPHLCGVTATCGKNDDPAVFLGFARAHASNKDGARPVSAGYSQAKAGFIISILEQFKSGKISGEKIARASDRQAMKMLTNLDGIGDWCAAVIMMQFLSRADVILYGDLTVRNYLNELYDINHQDASETLVESAADFDDNSTNRNLIDALAKKNGWDGYRSVVCFLMYHLQEENLVLL